MTVRRFRLTNHSKNAPDFNWKTGVDANTQVMSVAAGFAAHEADTPNMTVVVDAGRIQLGTTLTSKTAQTTGAITAPATNPRIDRVVMDYSGAISVISGVEAATPSAPAITVSKVAVCQIALVVGQTRILNTDITDERPLYFVANTLSALTVTDLTVTTLTLGGVAVNLPVAFGPVTLSGTSTTIINTIPSWVRRVEATLSAASTNGTSNLMMRLGPSGGPATSSYTGSVSRVADAVATMADDNSNGFRLTSANTAAALTKGIFTARLHDSSTNTWVSTFTGARDNGPGTYTGSGSIALSGALTQLTITTVGGADTFDNGTASGTYYPY